MIISLYSGAGGLDYGFEAAGFAHGVCVELDHDCCDSLRASRPKWNVIESSIFDVATDALLEASATTAGNVDVLIGGPPCQPFSKAGYWARGDSKRLDDPRAGTLGAYLRVLEEARPHAFLLENVGGLAFSGKDEGLRMLLDGVADINRRTRTKYRPEVRLVNAASFGVPQMRERVFVVGARDGARFAFPEPTHAAPDASGGTPGLFTRPLEPLKTAWDAIGDLDGLDQAEDLHVRGKWADLLPSIPEGNNYLWHTDRGGGRPLFGWRRRYWSFLLKLAKNRPSWTIQAQPGPAIGPFHWNDRLLSTRELCRLQTFPDDALIIGKRASRQKQLGNAVPSLLGETMARAIAEQYFGRSFSSPLRLLPAKRAPVPAPELTKAVPARFSHMEGEHSAHPGTGQGNRAALRESA